MKNLIESYVADTVLQNATPILVNGVEYLVSPPSTATLIELGKYLATLGQIKVDKKKDVISQVLSVAHRCDCFGDIAAILILGKKNLTTTKKVVKKSLFGYPLQWEEITVNNQAILAKEILDELDSEELFNLIVALLKSLKVDFFLAIITFLEEAQLNITIPTL